ncbi:MAG TPA: DUF4397 domain-containing protein [Mucilaginibacter sp.]|nr:DUF4397 domain-containing protein [Mucilaginibacter sp.]
MKARLSGILFITLITGMWACKNNNDAPTPVLKTNIDIVNASADTVNFYLNGTRLNNNSNLYPGSASFYLPVLSGQQTIQVKDAFNAASGIVRPLFNYPVRLDTGRFYSLFIAGTTQDKAFTDSGYLYKITTPDTCLVRFVNASPDAGTLNMSLGDTTQFQNAPFKTVTAFVAIGVSGQKTVKVYQQGNAAPIYTGVISLLANQSYTLFSMGTVGGKGTAAFKVGSTVNVN